MLYQMLFNRQISRISFVLFSTKGIFTIYIIDFKDRVYGVKDARKRQVDNQMFSSDKKRKALKQDRNEGILGKLRKKKN